MTVINFREKPGEGFFAEFMGKIRSYSGRGDLIICAGDVEDAELTVLSPGFSGDLRASRGAVLAPGDRHGEISSPCAVTYGMSGRNSVTLSSVGAGQCVLSVQRDIPTVLGNRLERQDIPVSPEPEHDGEWTAGLYGALLMAGIGPEMLCIQE